MAYSTIANLQADQLTVEAWPDGVSLSDGRTFVSVVGGESDLLGLADAILDAVHAALDTLLGTKVEAYGDFARRG